MRDANKWSNKMGLVPYSVALEAVVYGQAASLPDSFCSTMSFVPPLGLVETISHKSTKLPSQQPDKACDSSVCHVDTPLSQNSWSSRVFVLPVPRWQVCVSVGSFLIFGERGLIQPSWQHWTSINQYDDDDDDDDDAVRHEQTPKCVGVRLAVPRLVACERARQERTATHCNFDL